MKADPFSRLYHLIRETHRKSTRPKLVPDLPPIIGEPSKPARWVATVGNDQGEALEPFQVSHLAPEDQYGMWRSRVGTYWKWNNGRWWHADVLGGPWIAAPYGFVPDSTGPFTRTTAQSMTWLGWAVPAIQEVLAEHAYYDNGEPFDDWLDYVAPLIAERIGCDPQRAIAALSTYTPKVNR